jgi:hypothetical protein
MKPTLALTCAIMLTTASCGGSRSEMDTLPGPVGNDVLTHTFAGPRGEFVRVLLASGVDYEVELSGSNIRLAVRPLDASTQQPRVEELVPGTSAGGTSIFRVHARSDGEYEFRTLRSDATSPLTMRLRMLSAKPES